MQNRKILTMILAFAAVYLIWGSTYLGIKYAIETIPAFLMGGVRFLTAGAILLFLAKFTGDYERPQRSYWKTSFIVGALLLLVGNGGVVVAQYYIPSSIVALLIATEPFWVILISWLLMNGKRPNLRVILGILVGFAGVSLLIGGGNFDISGGNGKLLGIGLIVVSTIGWAFGSLYGLKAPAPKSTLQASGMQMLAGGFLLLLVSFLNGEWAAFSLAEVSLTSVLALGYLIMFGAVLGFTAYSWLMKNVEPSMASTYAYINPLVAVVLGWAIADEELSGQMLLGAGIIVGSVVLITSHPKKEKPEEDIHKSQIPPGACKPASAAA